MVIVVLVPNYTYYIRIIFHKFQEMLLRVSMAPQKGVMSSKIKELLLNRRFLIGIKLKSYFYRNS